MAVRHMVVGYLGLLLLFGWAAAQSVAEFVLQVMEVRGEVEGRGPEEQWRRLKEGDTVPIGGSVRTQERATAVLQWLPYKARVKLAPDTEVQLAPTRVLSVRRGRIWIGTPPPPMGERRFPLPLQCGAVSLVCAPDGFASIALRTDGAVIVSVDQGSVFASVGDRTVTVSRSQMAVIYPQGTVVGPMPWTRQEQLLWDMGGSR